MAFDLKDKKSVQLHCLRYVNSSLSNADKMEVINTSLSKPVYCSNNNYGGDRLIFIYIVHNYGGDRRIFIYIAHVRPCDFAVIVHAF